MSSEINTEFRLGNHLVTARAVFHGAIHTSILVDDIEIENGTQCGSEYPPAPLYLHGAALRSHERRWLREYATGVILQRAIDS